MSRFPCALNTLSMVQPRGGLGSSYKSTYVLYKVCEAHVEGTAYSGSFLPSYRHRDPGNRQQTAFSQATTR
jgi:hypothetical protein